MSDCSFHEQQRHSGGGSRRSDFHSRWLSFTVALKQRKGSRKRGREKKKKGVRLRKREQ